MNIEYDIQLYRIYRCIHHIHTNKIKQKTLTYIQYTYAQNPPQRRKLYAYLYIKATSSEFWFHPASFKTTKTHDTSV